MTLGGGTRLGPYEIIAPVGAGGMGQVYRARDTRLDRDVAVKVIESEQEPTAEQRQRFDREARAVAQLTHPHICALFDVGCESGLDFLVMELLQGETLDARLSKGPLPIDRCLSIGANIAAALAAAHDRGIVHRDLKPANVMLTASGPKLLDFGIAKAFGRESAIAERTATDAELTSAGMVVGTVPYLAPEQIEGKAPDARTDIFALGAVLYEMATGKAAFSAPTPVALVAAVLASDPHPIATIRQDTPAAFDRLVRHCLAKDPAERWHSAHDIELQLREMEAAPVQHGSAVRDRSLKRWFPWALTAGALAIAALAISRPPATPSPATTSVRFTIDPPPGGGFAWNTEANPLAISPDGQQLAFIAFDSIGEPRIWLRALSSGVATPLQATSDARSLMWSPDGRAIAFFTRDRLQRIDLPDGAPITLTQIASRTGQSGTWGSGGHILFGGVQGEALYRVASSGGVPEVVLRPDTTAGEARVTFPWYLPDGERFLYTLRRTDGSSALMVAMADQPSREIGNVESLAQYGAPGVLAFVRDGTLLGQAFDSGSGRVNGEPFAVAEGVTYFLSTGAAAIATSGGTLAFQTGRDLQRFVWLDRTGAEVGGVGSTGNYLSSTLSSDDGRVLVTRQQPELGTWDLWLVDLERGTETRLTSGRNTEAYGLWLPDGQTVVYSAGTGGPPNMVRRNLTTSAEVTLFPEPGFQIATDVSPDGRTLLYQNRLSAGTFDVWTIPVQGDGAPSPFLETPFSEGSPRFSPDGRFVAVTSDETGRPELYVMPFPGPGEKTRVSTSGALAVHWPRGSGEIMYLTPDGRMMAVSTQTQPTLRVGNPVTLFTTAAGATWTAFDVTSDGQRFLAAISVAQASRQPLTVITNWTSLAPR